MPFRLKLKKDSSLALVQYPVAGRADGGFGPSGRRSRLRASSLFDAQEGLDGASVEENDPTHASPDHLAEDHDPSSAAFNVVSPDISILH